MTSHRRSLELIVASLAVFVGALLATGCGPDYPNCEEDDDCHQGEYCVNGRCQLCRTGADCPSGQECQNGRCEPTSGYCRSARDCPRGQECRNNRCVRPTTATQDINQSTNTNNGPCQLENVLFEFDSSTLDDGARASLQRNADCIRTQNMAHVRMTGHTDPRGTEEYNLALGDRRARTALTYITSLGVEANKLTAASMGEEMSRGTDDDTWRQDRRVQFEQQQQ